MLWHNIIQISVYSLMKKKQLQRFRHFFSTAKNVFTEAIRKKDPHAKWDLMWNSANAAFFLFFVFNYMPTERRIDTKEIGFQIYATGLKWIGVSLLQAMGTTQAASTFWLLVRKPFASLCSVRSVAAPRVWGFSFVCFVSFRIPKFRLPPSPLLGP